MSAVEVVEPAGSVCADPRVSIAGALDTVWLEAVVSLCEDLGSIPDIDPQVRLRVIPAGTDVIVEASLPDGRTTLRRVRKPRDLRLTAEALATVPPAATLSKVDASAPPSSPDHEPAARSRPIGFELGAAALVRASAAPTYVSAGTAGYVGVRPGNWMLGVHARWEILEQLTSHPPRGYEMDSAGAGFFVARRLELSPAVRADVGGAATLLVEAQSFETSAGEVSGSSTDVRLGLFTRFLFGTSAWRWTLALDGELSPPRLRRALRVDPVAPQLPTWSAGLAIGASWGDP